MDNNVKDSFKTLSAASNIIDNCVLNTLKLDMRGPSIFNRNLNYVNIYFQKNFLNPPATPNTHVSLVALLSSYAW